MKSIKLRNYKLNESSPTNLKYNEFDECLSIVDDEFGEVKLWMMILLGYINGFTHTPEFHFLRGLEQDMKKTYNGMCNVDAKLDYNDDSYSSATLTVKFYNKKRTFCVLQSQLQGDLDIQEYSWNILKNDISTLYRLYQHTLQIKSKVERKKFIEDFIWRIRDNDDTAKNKKKTNTIKNIRLFISYLEYEIDNMLSLEEITPSQKVDIQNTIRILKKQLL